MVENRGTALDYLVIPLSRSHQPLLRSSAPPTNAEYATVIAVGALVATSAAFASTPFTS